MSIQVISSALLSANATSANLAAAEALPGDPGVAGFADLLAQQMLGPQLLNLDKSGKPASASGDKTDKSLESALSSADDPNLLAQAMPWLPPGSEVAAVVRQTLAPQGQLPDKSGGDDTLPAQLANLLGDKASAAPDKALTQTQTLAAPIPANVAADNAQQNFTDVLNKQLGTTPAALNKDPAQAVDQLAANFADSKPEAPTTSAAHLHTAQAAANAGKEIATPIPTPLHDQRWATDFGQKVVWAARAEQQSAQIQITPPQLGPIQISLNLSGDQASATFASPHAEVRQALEAAMPRLREMLADAGINLGQANVGSQFAQQQQGQENRQGTSDSPQLAVDNAILSGHSSGRAGTASVSGQGGQGLVDLFA